MPNSPGAPESALLDGYGSTETNFVIGTKSARPGRAPWAASSRASMHGWSTKRTTKCLTVRPANWCWRAEAPFAFATGYFGTPEKTVEAWRNLWFHTGDRVILECDGYFKFVDRLKDAIRRRGENISSFEVEQVLLSLSANSERRDSAAVESRDD